MDRSSFLSLGSQVVHILAASYTFTYTLSLQVFFLTSTWWNFLNPFNLGFDILGAGSLFFFFVLSPCFVYGLGQVINSRTIYDKVRGTSLTSELVDITDPLGSTSFNSETTAGSKSFVSRLRSVFGDPLYTLGVFPPLLIALQLLFAQYYKLRTVVSVFSLILSYTAHVNLVLYSPVTTKNFHVSMILGLVIFQVIRYATGSRNALVEYSTGRLGTDVWVIVFAGVFNVACSWYYTCKAPPLSEFSASASELSDATSLSLTTPASPRSVVPLALKMSSLLTLTIQYFSSSGALVKYIGFPPSGVEAVFIPVFALLSLSVTLIVNDVKIINSISIVTLVIGYIVAFVFTQLAGVYILSASLPFLYKSLHCTVKMGYNHTSMLMLTVTTGVCMFTYHIAYLSALMFKQIPLIYVLFGGKTWLVVLFYIVPLVSVLGMEIVRADDRSKYLPPSKEGHKSSLISMAAVAIFILLPCVLHRSLTSTMMLSEDISNDDNNIIKVMTFNIQNGYSTAGTFNGNCVIGVIEELEPDYVVLPEGDSMHVNTGNRDFVDYMASRVHNYEYDYGIKGKQDGVGVAVMSTRESLARQVVKLPKEDEGNLNRFMVINEYSVGGKKVVVAGVHLEWFGDPSMQTSFIVDFFKDHDFDKEGGVIVTGDFNLEPSGGNNNAVKATAFDVFKENGWRSVTPMECNEGTQGNTEGHICKSNFSTAIVSELAGSADVFPVLNYQLDWILFKGVGLDVVENSVVNVLGEVKKPENGEKAFCSDHTPLMANFIVE